MVKNSVKLLGPFVTLKLLYIFVEFPCGHVTSENDNESSLCRHHHSSFSYNNPEKWSKFYPECNGSAQSPIHITSDELQEISYDTHLTFNGYRHIPNRMYVINTGHTIQVTASWEDYIPHLSGGPLNGSYTFEHLHFHWNDDDFDGSEHIINNESFVIEMHVVHYKTEYGNMQKASEYEDGLVVTAHLFTLSYIDTTYGVKKLRKHINYIRAPVNEKRRISPFPLSLFDLEFQVDYIMYRGSLSTPPCTESVTWLICSNHLSITPRQHKIIFKRLRLSHHNRHNRRPVQPINDRDVYYIIN